MPVDVSELYALADDLKASGRRVRREVTKVVKETTDQAAESMRIRAPRGPSGDLIESIKGTSSGLKGEASTNLRYAQFVEFGTYKDEPQPFAAPTADEVNTTFPPAVEEAVVGALDL